MKAVRDRVVIKPDPEEKMFGSIIIPDMKKEQPMFGEVLAAGANEYGIEAGQRVAFNKWQTDKMEDGLISVKSRDVIAIL